MKPLVLAAGFALALGTTTDAFAWGEPGHEVIGSIAQAILDQPGHSKARQQVQSILNRLGHHTLSEASTWADCVRSVRKAGSSFELVYVQGKTPQICRDAFPQGNAAEVAAMTSYVKNNWSQCDYKKNDPGSGECHATYHFDDIPYQHGRYAEGDVSVSKHDIVSVIGDAMFYLKKGQMRPGVVAVFSDDREALFVLAHLVGDLHQPLHVGSVYLDGNGKVVDPGHDETLADKTFTTGGNFIFDGASNAAKPPELHGEWDTIPSSLGTSASPEFVTQAKSETPPDQGDYEKWPATWASETVALARNKAFKGLRYEASGNGSGTSSWTFKAPDDYKTTRAAVQETQLKYAGVRLARLLTAIWPD